MKKMTVRQANLLYKVVGMGSGIIGMVFLVLALWRMGQWPIDMEGAKFFIGCGFLMAIISFVWRPVAKRYLPRFVRRSAP